MHKFVFLFCFIFFINCNENDLQTCNDDTALFALADFPIGVAVGTTKLNNDTKYREIVMTQFNSITPDNAFKPESLHPFENDFDFAIADDLVTFAMQNGKRVHGHTLIWHNQLPIWMDDFSGDKTEWIAMMKNHIQTIVSHFGNSVFGWDVVNEAFEDNGDFRENIWYNNIGEDYIKLAFEFAHEANPNAFLFYNDYNIAQKNKKCEAIVTHFKKLKSEGVPVHGIGLQSHIYTLAPSDKEIETATETIAKEGFLIHFSEIDISMNLSGNQMNLTENKLQKQGQKMKTLTDIFQTIPTNQQYGMTVWGVSDSDSWIPSFFGREDYPLLYDANYEPKLMYCGFREGILN